MNQSATGPEQLAQLLKRASQGDSQALAELLARYERRLQLAARALVGQPIRHVVDSQDLVQSVHRAMLPGLQEGRYAFECEEQLIGLAITVLRHKVIRTAQRSKTKSSDTPLPEPVTLDQPDHAAVADETLQQILDSLEPIDQRIVEMRIAGCETAEIATAISTSAAIVRARLSRLRQALRARGLDQSTF